MQDVRLETRLLLPRYLVPGLQVTPEASNERRVAGLRLGCHVAFDGGRVSLVEDLRVSIHARVPRLVSGAIQAPTKSNARGNREKACRCIQAPTAVTLHRASQLVSVHDHFVMGAPPRQRRA